jgi:hypothetical protein
MSLASGVFSTFGWLLISACLGSPCTTVKDRIHLPLTIWLPHNGTLQLTRRHESLSTTVSLVWGGQHGSVGIFHVYTRRTEIATASIFIDRYSDRGRSRAVGQGILNHAVEVGKLMVF